MKRKKKISLYEGSLDGCWDFNGMLLEHSSAEWEYDWSTVIVKTFNQDHLVQSPTRKVYQASVGGDQIPTKSKCLHYGSVRQHSEDAVTPCGKFID